MVPRLSRSLKFKFVFFFFYLGQVKRKNRVIQNGVGSKEEKMLGIHSIIIEGKLKLHAKAYL